MTSLNLAGKKAPKTRLPQGSLVFYIGGEPELSEPYHFKSVGLPNVYLLNGVSFREDPNHGRLLTIGNIHGLMHAVGLAIIEKDHAFTGTEFRFLRKQMKLVQSELAKRMGVSEQTIANYEKGKTAPKMATAHMRLLFLLHILPPETVTRQINKLLEIGDSLGLKLPEVSRFKLVDGWRGPNGIAA